jgi:hypothetical protein
MADGGMGGRGATNACHCHCPGLCYIQRRATARHSYCVLHQLLILFSIHAALARWIIRPTARRRGNHRAPEQARFLTVSCTSSIHSLFANRAISHAVSLDHRASTAPRVVVPRRCVNSVWGVCEP